jgi:2-oxoglutarate dehydrogenase complex dehydrogenase (E1) component-like enzyme
MYKAIRGRKTVPSLYEEKLISEGVVSKAEVDEIRKAHFADLDKHLEESYNYVPQVIFPLRP